MKKLNINYLKKNLNKALGLIPLASQTFSKSYKLFDKKFFPLFSKSGNKQFIKDLDGNNFLDFISGLGSVSLGYSIDTQKTITNALNKGITFSLSHELEYKVANELKKIIPSAEMVKFGKNGTDVNSAAIRLARFYTKRSHIGVCGYHGWQDWYISSTNMNGGIPSEVRKYTHQIKFNDLKDLESKFNKFKLAAVMLEPFSFQLPSLKFLKTLKKLCKKNNTILIFDEVCTGFRVSLGGAQQIYGIKPDLSTFGKAMGNGFPISAVVGKKKIMKNFDKIFYSGTFGGETLSLAACLFVIKYLKKNKIIKKNIVKGDYLINSFNKISKLYKLDNILSLQGHPSWPFLVNKNVPYEKQIKIKTFIMQEFALNKILFFGTFIINASHTKEDMKKVLNVSNKTLKKLSENLKNLNKILIAKPTKPIFKVRD